MKFAHCHQITWVSWEKSRQSPRQSSMTNVCEQLDPKGHRHWVVKLIFSGEESGLGLVNVCFVES